MYRKKHTQFLRLTALVLALVLLVPASANAATAEPAQPFASQYLRYYHAYLDTVSGGKIRIYFTVEGLTTLDFLGASEIYLYHSSDNASWSFFKHFDSDDYSRMMGYNTLTHSNYIECKGSVGRYYKAMVYLIGSKNGQGNLYYYQTNSVRAVA